MTRTWSCGVRSLPATIEGDPPTPTVGVLWLCDGFVVRASVFGGMSPTDAQLRESFDEAVTDPLRGAPRGRPQRLHVDSDPLARRLRALLPELRVEVQATPDVDAAFDSLAEAMSTPPGSPMAELSEMDEVIRDALMPLAMELFELEPWEIFPADVPVRVAIPACGLSDGRLAVMGHNGQTYGAMLFLEDADYELFAACGEGMMDTSGLILPKCFSLNYVPVDPALLGGDPELGPFPLPLLSVFEGNAQRQPSRSEAKMLLAAIGGLARFTEKRAAKLAVMANWKAGISGRYRVPVMGEKLEVRLTAKT